MHRTTKFKCSDLLFDTSVRWLDLLFQVLRTLVSHLSLPSVFHLNTPQTLLVLFTSNKVEVLGH